MLDSQNLFHVCHWGRQWRHKNERHPFPTLLPPNPAQWRGKTRKPTAQSSVRVCGNRAKYGVSWEYRGGAPITGSNPFHEYLCGCCGPGTGLWEPFTFTDLLVLWEGGRKASKASEASGDCHREGREPMAKGFVLVWKDLKHGGSWGRALTGGGWGEEGFRCSSTWKVLESSGNVGCARKGKKTRKTRAQRRLSDGTWAVLWCGGAGAKPEGVSVDAGSWGRMSTLAFSGGLELSMNQLKITVLSAPCTPKYNPSKRVNAYTF